jgi:D-alanyl-D-alanine carboxypeptidase
MIGNTHNMTFWGFSRFSPKSVGDKALSRLVAFFLIASFAFVFSGQAALAQKKSSANAPNPKYASIVVDAGTGAVISQRNANKSLHPASLTKVMTLLLLFDAMERGEVRLSDKIMISQRAANAAPSKLGLPAGSSIRVEDAILAMVTKSANDISIAVGEHLGGGSEDRFATRMTHRARGLGMTNTTYKNAHGLHNPAQVTTARDQAILARYVIARYPHYYRYFSTKQFTYRGKTYTNHNRLMSSYPGMDGFKTGFINASGFNLIASAKNGNQRLIGVVFGGRSWKSRNDHMAEILDAAFTSRGTPVGEIRTAQIDAAPRAVAKAPTPPPSKPVREVEVALAPPSATTTTAAVSSANAEAENDEQFYIVQYADSAAANSSSQNILAEQVSAIAPSAPEAQIAMAPIQPRPDTDDAIRNVRSAINSGEYSEVTGQGDYDTITTRRIETGLLAAAVYKGEAQYQKASATTSAKATSTASNIVLDPEQNLALPSPSTYQPAALHTPRVATADLWSVQIGAYTSRVAADDALRRAQTKLPSNLAHAGTIVVPLKTGEGMLFRGRLVGLTQAQASEACRHFRDCLPLAPQ